MRSSQLVATAFIGCLVLVVCIAVGTSAADAQANDGLQVSSSTLYEPDPAREQISVTSSYTLTNLQPDEVIGDSVRSFFYTKWVIAMPATATDFAASSNGQPLQAVIEADPDSNDVVFGTITLPFNLNFEQTVQLDVRFSIPGGEPRTEGTGARINDSFLSFSIWAAGDSGRTDVRVTIPAGFTVDLQGDLDELQETNTPDGVVLEAIGIQEPQDFFGQVYGRNDSGLLTETASLPGATATIRAWPDDPEWAEFVAKAIEQDVPIIEDLTGLDWPAGDIEVIETVTPYLFGYGGWFNASSGRIEIGDLLERDLILHELGHAWFNEELIAGRWITEGLAEEFAARAIETSDGERLEPDTPDLADPLRVPLAAWASPWTLDEETAFDYEQYHYNASWWVIRQITNDIGLQAFSEVLIALQNDEIPYLGEGPAETTSEQTQWTHLFDLVEQQGASDLDELFADYVLIPSDIAQLERRQTARDDYASLLETGAGWSAPLVVRQEMTAWDFEGAQASIATARDILATRDQIDALADELDISVDHPSELAFETASTVGELEQAHQLERDLLNSLINVQDDRIELVNQAAAVNTTVTFEPMSFDEATATIAAQSEAVAAVQTLRDRVDDAASGLNLVAPDWPAATDFDAPAALAEARLATLTAIGRASDAVNEPRSLMQSIGLTGSDPEKLLDDARRAFEADDLDEALEATGMAEMTLANAAAAGQTRVMWGAGLMLAVVVSTLMIARYQNSRGPRISTGEVAA